jgi:mutator protein MutT
MNSFVIPEAEIRAQAAKDGVTHFATGVAVVRNAKVLVVRRAPDDHLGGWYELPGGGVDEGETFAAAAIRETLEETGLTVQETIGTIDGFDYQTPHKPKVRQINFVVHVQPGKVKLNPHEHDRFQWVGAADVDSLKATEEIKRCLRDFFNNKHLT